MAEKKKTTTTVCLQIGLSWVQMLAIRLMFILLTEDITYMTLKDIDIRHIGRHFGNFQYAERCTACFLCIQYLDSRAINEGNGSKKKKKKKTEIDFNIFSQFYEEFILSLSYRAFVC